MWFWWTRRQGRVYCFFFFRSLCFRRNCRVYALCVKRQWFDVWCATRTTKTRIIHKKSINNIVCRLCRSMPVFEIRKWGKVTYAMHSEYTRTRPLALTHCCDEEKRFASYGVNKTQHFLNIFFFRFYLFGLRGWMEQSNRSKWVHQVRATNRQRSNDVAIIHLIHGFQ